MDKKDKDNSFKYQIIGAVTFLLLLVIVLPTFLHNSEEEKIKEVEAIQQSIANGSDSEWRSSIQPMDQPLNDGNGESLDYQVDELSMDEKTEDKDSSPLDGAVTPVAPAINEPVIEDIDADMAVMNDLITDDNAVAQEDATEITTENTADNASNEVALAAEKAKAEAKKEADKKVVDPIEKIVEQHTGSSSTKSFAGDNVAVGWIVQVGTFSEANNAQRMIDKLSANGFQPQYNLVDSNGQKVTRVWVGPYEKRVFASEVEAKVESVVGIKPFIRSYP